MSSLGFDEATKVAKKKEESTEEAS